MQILEIILNIVMKKNIKNGLKFWVFLAAAVSALYVSAGFLAQQANADLLDNVKKGGLDTIGKDAYGSTSQPADIRIIVVKIIKVLFGFLGIVFIGLTIWAGYNWMMAGGDPAKITEARNRLVAGVIGLIIILSAWSITTFVTDCVMKVTTNTGNIWLCPGSN